MMNIQFVRATQTDREAARAILSDAAYAAAYAGPQTLQSMRDGTEALVQHSAIRKVSPNVQIQSKQMGGVPCEVLAIAGADQTRAILYIHGGAFIRGSLALGRANAAWIAESIGISVIAVGYRQAPEHPYPAASNDVRHVYEALLSEGITPSSIAVVGESSGGCLALGLVVDLFGRSMELPAGVAVLSPMVDLAMRGASWLYNHDRDVASRAIGQKAIDLYIEPSRINEPIASPVGYDFQQCCPLFIGIGSHETMLSDAERLAHKADAADVAVDFHIYEDQPHGFTRLESPVAGHALADAARWCCEKVSASRHLSKMKSLVSE